MSAKNLSVAKFWPSSPSWLSPNVLFGYLARTESGERPSEHNAVRRPKIPKAFRRVAPFLAGAGGVLLVAMVLVAIYFTQFDLQWATFLGGMLCASILSLASRSLRAEWLIARRTAQLSQARANLASEVRLRERAEDDLACIVNTTVYLHESLPAMLAYIDDTRQIKYHNRAFREGLGASVSKIDGRPLREVVGDGSYGELDDDLAGAFAGSVVYRERSNESNAATIGRQLLQYLPQLDDSGCVAGVFLLSTDVPARFNDIAAAPAAQPVAAPIVEAPHRFAVVIDETQTEEDDDELRLRNALARNEFCLFFQSIEPVSEGGDTRPFREILLRLKVEEENMMPPGSFLPVAEEHGMLPDLDRWVVRHLLAWLCADQARRQAVYSVNISAQTMIDRQFPAFVQQALRESGIRGDLLCFELQEADVLTRAADARQFIDELRPEGCRFALCGFSGNRASFEQLREIPVNFLKIDSGLILNMQRSAVDLARVKAISRVAKGIGIGTIAECVEDSETLEQLREIGIDFAQGFGISRPQDLAQIPAELALGAAHEPTTPRTDSALSLAAV